LKLNLSRIEMVERAIGEVLEVAARLKALKRRMALCRSRGWIGGLTPLMEEAEQLARDIPYVGTDLDRARQAAAWASPSLRDIYLDLQQAEDEFGDLAYDTKEQTLSVTTEAIELEGVYLGPFEIRLDIRRLGEARATPYTIEALDPHPATSNEAVTHPHVSDGRLCAGDGGAAIQAALAAGRIFDFFSLVQAVLTNYNPQSPYVSLDEWSGIACHECGYSVSQDDVYWCAVCENDFCQDCSSYCSRCNETVCHNCLETCPVCDESVCPGCLDTCPRCGRNLCRTCLEEEQCPCKEEQEEDDEPDTSRNEGSKEGGRETGQAGERNPIQSVAEPVRTEGGATPQA
jgi:hypothetical protein